MKKNTIRLTESQLHNVIKESVRRILSEADVVRGTNTSNSEYRSADEWDEYTHEGPSYKNENDRVLDFVQMWADRLENYLIKNLHCEDERDLWVTAHMDNESNSTESLFSFDEKNNHKIVFDVEWNYTLSYGKNNKIKHIIAKAAYLLFGSIEGCDISYESGRDSSFKIILDFDDYYHFYSNGNELERKKVNPLFQHNKYSQIPKDNSAYQD